MDGASAIAGLIGLAGLVLETTLKIRELCKGYSAAQDEVDGVSRSLQALQDLLQETQRLAADPTVVKATTHLTRARMTTVLTNCKKDLQAWIYRIDHAIPKDASKMKQRWKKVIIAVDKPKLADLTSKTSAYVSQIDALLGVMRGDLGVATNVSIVGMIWSQGIFQYDTRRQLEAIMHGVNTLQYSQDGFRVGTFTRLDTMGSIVSSIEVNIQELLDRSAQAVPDPVPKNHLQQGCLLVPYTRNGNFVGRKRILDEVELKMNLPQSNHRVALYGLGGVGKSQVAIELAYRAQAKTPAISCFWVSAVSRTTFAQSYREIASSLGVSGVDNPKNDALELVKSWLQKDQTGQFLLIVDNVDDLKTLKGEAAETEDGGFNLLKYLPQCSHGTLLFTTRSRTAALRLTGGGTVVEIPAMEAGEAQQLLRVRLDEDDPQNAQDCLDLVKALEYLPLPISHAASYIREMGITPARYLRMFNDDKKRAKLLKHTYEDLARDGGQTNTVLTTWRISFEQIQRESPDSADLLKLMGSLHWQDMPQYLLQQDKLEDEDDFDDAMSPLIAFSLVQKSAESKMFSMHRLIHIAIKSWNQTLEWERVAQRMLLQVFPSLEINQISADDSIKCRQLLPHAQRVQELLGLSDKFTLNSIQLKYRVATYQNVLGQYSTARDLLESLIAPLQEFSQRGITVDFSLADAEDQITRIYLSEGNDKVAIERARKALDTRLETLSSDHPDLVRAKDLVALALMAQSNYKEAEAQLQDAYKATSKSHGLTDMMTIAVLLSLSAAYTGQEQHQRAADTYKAALDVLIPLYGERNDCVIRCMAGMSEALRCMYKTDEAGPLIRKAAALAEETMGPDHPITLAVIIKLGCQLIDEGENDKAFVAFERVWKNRQRMYGDESKLTLNCLWRMATVHPSIDESVRLIKIAVERSKRLHGVMAAKTMGLENELARIYCARDLPTERREAETFCRNNVERRSNALGTDARATLKAGTYLAQILALQFRYDEAIEVYKHTLERQTATLGEFSEDARITESLFTALYNSKRDFDACEVLLHHQLKVLEKTRGPYNRLTLDTKSCLGATVSIRIVFTNTAATRLRATEGGVMMTEAYEDLLKHYGEWDECTVLASSRLGKYYNDIKEYDKSEEFYQKSVAGMRRRFGDDGRGTLSTEALLAWTMVRESKCEEAREILLKVFASQRRLFTDDCVDLTFTSLYLSVATFYLDTDHRVEGYEVAKKETLTRSMRLLGKYHKVTIVALTLVNIFKDTLFLLATADWAIEDSERAAKTQDFETLAYPRRSGLASPKLRREKSWYLASICPRLYNQDLTAEDRASDFRNLRGESPDTEPETVMGVTCTRCQNGVPMVDWFYRCDSPPCNEGGFYVVCQSCHKAGLACLHFEHDRRRVKAYRVCDICHKDIKDHCSWICLICNDGDYDVCLSCYNKGERCAFKRHKLVKRVQACFKNVMETGDHYWCDKCGGDIEYTDFRWHCNVCMGGQYDLCESCWNWGDRCNDEKHILTRRNQDDKEVDENGKVKVVETKDNSEQRGKEEEGDMSDGKMSALSDKSDSKP